MLLISIALTLIVLSIALYPLISDDAIKRCGNDYIDISGKWKLVNTTLMMKNVTINNTCGSEFTIEFFINETCKELVDCINNSWVWTNYSTYDDYIIFGNDSVQDNMDYFKIIFYNVTDFGSRLSLYHAHLMMTKIFMKIN